MPNDPIVEVAALGTLGPVRYLDVRDAASFAAGSAPGAHNVAADSWDAAAKSGAVGFSDLAHWQGVMDGLGLGPDTLAVIFDNGGMTNAARVWFMLQHFGGKGVIVNGGWPAMQGQPMPAGIGPVSPGFKLRPGSGAVALYDRERLKAEVGTKAQVYDTRTRAEYTGEDPRKNARGGHLPGARHLSHVDLMVNGHVRPAAELKGMLSDVGFAPDHNIVTHCEGGGRAALGAVAALRAGFGTVGVYYLSFADWARDESCPIVRD